MFMTANFSASAHTGHAKESEQGEQCEQHRQQ